MPAIFEKIRVILNEKFSFHYDQIQPETKLELELGVNSREMLELIIEFEAAFGIEIDFDDIDEIIEKKKSITIQNVVDYIQIRLQLYNQ